MQTYSTKLTALKLPEGPGRTERLAVDQGQLVRDHEAGIWNVKLHKPEVAEWVHREVPDSPRSSTARNRNQGVSTFISLLITLVDAKIELFSRLTRQAGR